MRAAIALGSNLASRFGSPAANLHVALDRLSALGEVTAVSSFYSTDPVGYTEQPRFTNAAALLATDLQPLPLLHALLAIEYAMGRVRAADSPPKGPRIIDLDLLLFEDGNSESIILAAPELTLPHPELHRRAFVLEPLAEIAPGLFHPTLGVRVGELWNRLGHPKN